MQVRKFPGIKVYGGSNAIPGLTEKVKDEDTFKIGENINVRFVNSARFNIVME